MTHTDATIYAIPGCPICMALVEEIIAMDHTTHYVNIHEMNDKVKAGSVMAFSLIGYVGFPVVEIDNEYYTKEGALAFLGDNNDRD